jgi:hypothetical protein
MRYAVTTVTAVGTLAGFALAACGGVGGFAAPSPLASVCTQSEDAAVEFVKVSAPGPGIGVQSPLRVTGQVNTPDGLFYISIVAGDGTHIIDYPVHTAKGGGLAPFDQQVPFSIFGSTPACLWVYRNSADSGDAVRIPIVLEPSAAPTTTQGGS